MELPTPLSGMGLALGAAASVLLMSLGRRVRRYSASMAFFTGSAITLRVLCVLHSCGRYHYVRRSSNGHCEHAGMSIILSNGEDNYLSALFLKRVERDWERGLTFAGSEADVEIDQIGAIVEALSGAKHVGEVGIQ